MTTKPNPITASHSTENIDANQEYLFVIESLFTNIQTLFSDILHTIMA